MKNHFLTIWILSVVPLFMLGAEIGTPLLAQTSDTVVAKVNGRSITLKEVDSSITSQLFPLEQKIYAIRKAALENLMLRVLLEHEAMRLGISVEELRRRMTAGKVEVAPSQVNELYSENASVFAAMSPDEAKERLRLDLESQARMVNYRKALESWKKSSNVQMLLDEPTLTTPNAESGPSIGSKEAAVTIIEFSDFQCPYCRTSQGALKEVLKSYGSAVRIVFKHMPLDIHSEAFAAAQAAFCAGEQGSFWQYHDALFDSQAFSQKAFDKIRVVRSRTEPRQIPGLYAFRSVASRNSKGHRGSQTVRDYKHTDFHYQWQLSARRHGFGGIQNHH